MTTPPPATHGRGEYISFLEQRIEKLECIMEKRDDYLELLMRYMQRMSDRVVWPYSTPVYLWDDFKGAYPSTAAEMEKWLEAKIAQEGRDD